MAANNDIHWCVSMVADDEKMETEADLQDLYTWIDEIPLSRPKKNITRDFSDGVLAAEVLAHFYPRVVELHNYTPANSKSQKLDNWHTLNRKILSKIDLTLPEELIDGIVSNKQGVIEHVLSMIRRKVEGVEARNKDTVLEECNSYNSGKYQDGPPSDLERMEAAFLKPLDINYNRYDSHYHHTKPGHQRQHIDVKMDSTRHPPPADVRHLDNSSRLPLPNRKHPSHKDCTPLSLPPIVRTSQSSSAPHAHSKDSSTISTLLSQRKWSKQTTTVHNNNTASRRMELAEKDQIIMESQEAIQLLQMKIHRLEHLLEIKDMKIEDLTKQLKSVSMTQHHSKYRKY